MDYGSEMAHTDLSTVYMLVFDDVVPVMMMMVDEMMMLRMFVD